jgi:hypothetical protein
VSFEDVLERMVVQGLPASTMTTLGKESRIKQLTRCNQCFLKESETKRNQEEEKAKQLEAKRLEVEENNENQKKDKGES